MYASIIIVSHLPYREGLLQQVYYSGWDSLGYGFGGKSLEKYKGIKDFSFSKKTLGCSNQTKKKIYGMEYRFSFLWKFER